MINLYAGLENFCKKNAIFKLLWPLLWLLNLEALWVWYVSRVCSFNSNEFYPLISILFAESALFVKWGYSGLGVRKHKVQNTHFQHPRGRESAEGSTTINPTGSGGSLRHTWGKKDQISYVQLLFPKNIMFIHIHMKRKSRMMWKCGFVRNYGLSRIFQMSISLLWRHQLLWRYMAPHK